MTAKERAKHIYFDYRDPATGYALLTSARDRIEQEIQAAIDEAIAEERKPKSIEQLNEQQGTKPWTGESLGDLSDKETDELLAAIHEGSEEARIQRAVDEALERAALHVENGVSGNTCRDVCERIAGEIRALKSQPQPLPPTVKHDPAVRDSMRAIPEQPPYLPSTMKNEYDR